MDRVYALQFKPPDSVCFNPNVFIGDPYASSRLLFGDFCAPPQTVTSSSVGLRFVNDQNGSYVFVSSTAQIENKQLVIGTYNQTIFNWGMTPTGEYNTIPAVACVFVEDIALPRSVFHAVAVGSGTCCLCGSERSIKIPIANDNRILSKPTGDVVPVTTNEQISSDVSLAESAWKGDLVESRVLSMVYGPISDLVHSNRLIELFNSLMDEHSKIRTSSDDLAQNDDEKRDPRFEKLKKKIAADLELVALRAKGADDVKKRTDEIKERAKLAREAEKKRRDGNAIEETKGRISLLEREIGTYQSRLDAEVRTRASLELELTRWSAAYRRGESSYDPLESKVINLDYSLSELVRVFTKKNKEHASLSSREDSGIRGMYVARVTKGFTKEMKKDRKEECQRLLDMASETDRCAIVYKRANALYMLLDAKMKRYQCQRDIGIAFAEHTACVNAMNDAQTRVYELKLRINTCIHDIGSLRLNLAKSLGVLLAQRKKLDDTVTSILHESVNLTESDITNRVTSATAELSNRPQAPDKPSPHKLLTGITIYSAASTNPELTAEKIRALEQAKTDRDEAGAALRASIEKLGFACDDAGIIVDIDSLSPSGGAARAAASSSSRNSGGGGAAATAAARAPRSPPGEQGGSLGSIEQRLVEIAEAIRAIGNNRGVAAGISDVPETKMLRQELDTTRRDLQGAKIEIEQLRGTIAVLNENLADSKRERERLDEQLRAQTLHIEQLEARISASTQELDQLRRERITVDATRLVSEQTIRSLLHVISTATDERKRSELIVRLVSAVQHNAVVVSQSGPEWARITELNTQIEAARLSQIDAARLSQTTVVAPIQTGHSIPSASDQSPPSSPVPEKRGRGQRRKRGPRGYQNHQDGSRNGDSDSDSDGGSGAVGLAALTIERDELMVMIKSIFQDEIKTSGIMPMIESIRSQDATLLSIAQEQALSGIIHREVDLKLQGVRSAVDQRLEGLARTVGELSRVSDNRVAMQSDIGRLIATEAKLTQELTTARADSARQSEVARLSLAASEARLEELRKEQVDLVNAYKADTDRLGANHRASTERWRSEADELRRQLVDSRAAHNAEIIRLEASAQKAKRASDAEILELKSQFEQARNDERARMATEMTRCETRYDEARRKSTDDMVKLRSRYMADRAANTTEIARLEAAYRDSERKLTEELRDLRASTNREKSELHARYDTEMKRIEGQHSESVQKLETQLTELRAGVARRRDELRAGHDADIRRLEKSHTAALAKLRGELQDEHKRELADLRADHERAMDELKREQAGKIARIKEVHQVALEARGTEAAEEIKRLRDEFADTLARKAGQEAEKIKQASERTRSVLIAQAEHRLNGLLNDHRKEINRINTEHRGELRALQDQVREVSDKEQTQAGIIRDLTQQLTTLRSSIRSTLYASPDQRPTDIELGSLVGQLVRDLAEKTSGYAALNQAQIELSAGMSRVSDENVRIRTENQTLRIRNQEIQAHLNDAIANGGRLDERIAQLTAAVSASRDEVMGESDTITRLRDELDELKQRLVVAESQRVTGMDLDDANEELKTRLDDLETHNKALTLNEAIFQERIGTLQRTIDTLHETNRAETALKSKAEREFKDAETARLGLLERVAALEARTRDMPDLAQLTEASEHHRKDAIVQRESVKSLQTGVNDLTREVQRLYSAAEAVTAERDDLAQEVRQLKDKCLSLDQLNAQINIALQEVQSIPEVSGDRISDDELKCIKDTATIIKLICDSLKCVTDAGTSASTAQSLTSMYLTSAKVFPLVMKLIRSCESGATTLRYAGDRHASAAMAAVTDSDSKIAECVDTAAASAAAAMSLRTAIGLASEASSVVRGISDTGASLLGTPSDRERSLVARRAGLEAASRAGRAQLQNMTGNAPTVMLRIEQARARLLGSVRSEMIHATWQLMEGADKVDTQMEKFTARVMELEDEKALFDNLEQIRGLLAEQPSAERMHNVNRFFRSMMPDGALNKKRRRLGDSKSVGGSKSHHDGTSGDGSEDDDDGKSGEAATAARSGVRKRVSNGASLQPPSGGWSSGDDEEDIDVDANGAANPSGRAGMAPAAYAAGPGGIQSATGRWMSDEDEW